MILVALGLTVRHRQRLPSDGPAVLAGNHNSNLDALAIMSLMPLRLLPKLRPVAAMDYFYTSRLRGWFANNIVGIIPVKRGSGKEGGNPLQLAEEALERGEILVIFPEGTRGEPETLQAFKKGIGHLAHAHPKVPVVPIFMHGLGKALPRGSMLLVPFNVTVNVGEPVYGTDSYAEFVSKLERAMTALAAEEKAIVFLAFIAYLALKEYLSLIPTRRIDRDVLLFAYLAIPIQFYWAAIDWYGMFIVFVPVWMFLFFPALMAFKGETQGFLRAVGTLSWGLMMTVFTLSHTAWLLVSGDRVNPIAGGVGLLFFLVVLTQFNDVAQYCWGKLTGRHQVTPTVSPKKTWEGLIGGVATTVVVAALIGPYLTPMDWRWSALAGLILGVAGFLGDITLSAVKRDLGVKDTGGLIPGHGGLLDRVDSLTYAAPAFVHFIRYFFYP